MTVPGPGVSRHGPLCALARAGLLNLTLCVKKRKISPRRSTTPLFPPPLHPVWSPWGSGVTGRSTKETFWGNLRSRIRDWSQHVSSWASPGALKSANDPFQNVYCASIHFHPRYLHVGPPPFAFSIPFPLQSRGRYLCCSHKGDVRVYIREKYTRAMATCIDRHVPTHKPTHRNT